MVWSYEVEKFFRFFMDIRLLIFVKEFGFLGFCGFRVVRIGVEVYILGWKVVIVLKGCLVFIAILKIRR